MATKAKKATNVVPVKRPRGQQPFVPTDEDRKQVSQMTAVGIPQESIARIIGDQSKGGIDLKTLRKYFRQELDTAKVKAHAQIGGMLFNKAMGGDTTAAIFWAKTQMGWKETNVQENVGKDGGPITYRAERENLVDQLDQLITSKKRD
jgi:hypothetical protein